MIDLDAREAGTKPAGVVELFRLGGRVFAIPEKARVNVALKYLWMAKTKGEEVAGQWMLEQLLGDEAYQALMEFDDLEPGQLAAILAAAQKVVLGSLEQGKA
jgi:hypothetical protein